MVPPSVAARTRRAGWAACGLLAFACFAGVAGGWPAVAAPRPQQGGPGEFDASPQGGLRIESERKLRVPDEDVEPLWRWLDERFTDLSWLDDAQFQFSENRGIETFFDTYFDDADLTVLAQDAGVRHRRRIVHSGSALAKDGRELLQIKVAVGDVLGIARGEIKYEVDPPKRRAEPGDHNPVLGLIARSKRAEVIAQLQSLGLDPWSLRPVLTVEQLRRRIYLADRAGSFATLTLDECKCDDHGAGLAWTEIELELNEIRYTAASPAERLAYEAVVDRIEREITGAFPGVVRDQMPKYTKAFHGIDREMRLPLATMHRLDLTVADLWAVGGLLALAAAVLAFWRYRARAISTTSHLLDRGSGRSAA